MKHLAILSALLLSGCAAFPAGESAAQDTQQVATVLRQAEGWFPTPATFNVYYETLALKSPTLAAHAAGVEAQYAKLYADEHLTTGAIETVAAIYDTK